MKTIKKIVLVVLMLVTLSSYASDKKNFNNRVNAKKVKIEFTNVRKGNFLYIKDVFGFKLYSEEIKTNGSYSKYFDFSLLKMGNYTIELDKSTELIKNIFSKKGKVVLLKKSDLKTVNKPVIYLKNNKIFLSKLNFDKQALKVEVFFNGNLVHKEVLKSKSNSLYRIYKLQNSIKGEYRIVVKSNNRNYIQSFKL